ncbi:hypothetical protein [Spirulina sp. 06S082]|uniref:hypothetical protein n=1 Tax=Spirulina sp. 06S082 TaxID=3110248 RepID=UPI002B21D140|nr:hypothetical protein [Spirulina sp. 06S082]MEA5471537.1 hypothetical protein [Spirulina sp. 06S082]
MISGIVNADFEKQSNFAILKSDRLKITTRRKCDRMMIHVYLEKAKNLRPN